MKGFYHDIKIIKEGKEGETVKFIARISMLIYAWIDQVKIHINGDTSWEEELNYSNKDEKYAYFEKSIYLPNRAIYKYNFSFYSEWSKYYTTENYKLSVGFKVPDWAKGAVQYQIFIDRFNRNQSVIIKPFGRRKIHEKWDELPILGPDENGEWNTDSFGGNLKGIEDKLEYLKSLGVEILYISPISESDSNHKYDGEDLEKIDRYFGDKEAIKSLCTSAHKYDMKVMVDVVFNHVGKNSKYYNEGGFYKNLGAYQSTESPYMKFFKTRVENGKIVFEFWWNIKDLVVCDKMSKEWQEYICGEGGIIDLLFSYGIDAIRVDVADEIPDIFLAMMRDACHRNKKDSFIMGEVWNNPLRTGRGYISSGKCLDSVMNYYFISKLLDYLKFQDDKGLEEAITDISENYPEDTIFTLMNFTSTHDISRMLDLFTPDNIFKLPGEEGREWYWTLKDRFKDRKWQSEYFLSKEAYKYAKKMAKLYIFILVLFPGIISIYYGDEVGVQGVGDLANRKTFPWGKEDKDMLSYVRKTLKVRTDNDFLRTAKPDLVEITPDKWVFTRKNQGKNLTVIINNGYTNLDVKQYCGDVIVSCDYDQYKHIIRPKGGIALMS